MQPNSAVRTDADTALEQAAAIGFAQVFAATPAGPMVAHAPVTRHGDRLRFHVARANRIVPHLDGAAVLVGVAGVEGYVSPNWYTRPGDQVPTWNYVAVEIDGVAATIDEAALVEQLDLLAAIHEPRVNPANPWTRGKMADEVFRTMLRAIIGFEVTVTAVRATTKLSQNKPPADRLGVVTGLHGGGSHALADAMAGAGAGAGPGPGAAA